MTRSGRARAERAAAQRAAAERAAEGASAERLPATRPGFLRQLWRFGVIQLACCALPIAIFAGLAVSQLVWSRVDLPFARSDALLVYVVALQAILLAVRYETGRELGVICAFHLIGLALEVFKVAAGSWEYVDPGVLQIGGVPLYSGFLYASVGSYICQAFRRFDLRVTAYRPWAALAVAVLAYANFFAHHWIADLRWVIALGFLVVLWPSRVHFRVGPRRYWMPLAAAYVLIGGFLWLAENAGTLLQGWRYPNQQDGWEMVHASKLGSWTLLVSLSFVLVAFAKAREGRLYGEGEPSVTGPEATSDAATRATSTDAADTRPAAPAARRTTKRGAPEGTPR